MMEFKRFTELDDCKKLWEKFSSKVSLWELWDFNICFFDSSLNKLCFVVGYENGKEVGILPLMFDNDLGFYCFFGGNYPERRKFFIKDKSKVMDFLDSFKENLCLEYIDDSEHEFVRDSYVYDSSFSLDLNKFPSLHSFFDSFSKKHKKNVKYDLKHLEKFDYKLIWNNVIDFDRLVELNKKRFGDDSNYFQHGFEDGMKRLIKIAEKKLHMVSIKVDKKIEAVEIGILFNKVYYVLDGGANIKIANIGKLLIVEHIKRAIGLGAVKVDFLSSDSGWKKLWKLDETKQWEWCNFEE